MFFKLLSFQLKSKFACNALQTNKRQFWAWLNIVFNRVDADRIKEVGPDRACAEWLLRNGAQVTFAGDNPTFDYNMLAAMSSATRKILVAIEADDASITHHGFRHLNGCTGISKIKFHRCTYVSDKAVEQLGYVKNSLQNLQISSCDDVTDKGVLSLTKLSNLKDLTLFDLRVKDWKKCEEELVKALPSCNLKIKKI